jgi:probable HAF family extracellular repeat protein
MSYRHVLSALIALALAACRDTPTDSSPAPRPEHPWFAKEVVTSLTDLGTAGGVSSNAWAGNESGQVVGNRFIEGGGVEPVLWTDGVPEILPGLSGSIGESRDLNALGQVAGYVSISGGGSRPVIWTNSVPRELSLLPGATSGVAVALNDEGDASGQVTGARLARGVLWRGETVADLGTLGGNASLGEDINPIGIVVGEAQTAAGFFHAFRWENGMMTDLGTLGGLSSDAQAINLSGQIVGRSTTSNGETHAFIWENGTMTDLGTLGTGTEAEAIDINDLGQVVGSSELSPRFPDDPFADPPAHAFLWQDGVMVDLGALSRSGGASAMSLTTNGLVAGWSFDFEENSHAVLWTLSKKVTRGKLPKQK